MNINLNSNNLSLILIEGLKFLRQKIQKGFEDGSPEEILKYAIKNWDIAPLQQIKNIELNPNQRLIADSAHT